jgi:histidinol-phosphate phosphatase family protein
MNEIQVLILVGGKGTRLQTVVSDVPKPMADIDGVPFLEYLLRYLSQQGFKNFCLLTGYKKEVIYDYFGNGADFDIQVSYSNEMEPLGTGGAIKKAVSESLFENFLVLNGDTFFQIDYKYFVSQGFKKNALANMALHFTSNMGRYGVVEFNENNQVTSFVGNGTNNKLDGFINAGAYLLRRDIINYICEGYTSLESDVFPKLVNLSEVYSFPVGGNFIDIGVPDDYALSVKLIPKWMSYEPRPALFLDRDGILVEDTRYLSNPVNIRINIDIVPILKLMQNQGFLLIIVSNQAGLAKGIFNEEQLKAVQKKIECEFKDKHGIRFDGVYISPYHEAGNTKPFNQFSYTRKPECGMVMQAQEDFVIDIRKSFMVGDKDTDYLSIDDLKTFLVQEKYKLIEKKCVVLKNFKELEAALVDEIKQAV